MIADLRLKSHRVSLVVLSVKYFVDAITFVDRNSIYQVLRSCTKHLWLDKLLSYVTIGKVFGCFLPVTVARLFRRVFWLWAAVSACCFAANHPPAFAVGMKNTRASRRPFDQMHPTSKGWESLD